MSDRIIRFLLVDRETGRMAERLAALTIALPEGVTMAYGMRDPAASAAGTAHGDALGDPPLLFDAFLEFREAGAGGLDRLEEFALGAVEQVAPAIDLSRSSAIAGHRHVLMTRGGPCMMIFALTPPTAMTPPDFFAYWRDRHAPMVIAASGGKGSYYQLHGNMAASTRLAERLSLRGPIFAGHAGGWMKDPALLGKSLSFPASVAALEDERQFIDHARSSMGVFRYNGPEG